MADFVCCVCFAEGLAKIRRYDRLVFCCFRCVATSTNKYYAQNSPDEHPFTPKSLLPLPILPPLNYPSLLYPNSVNVNPTILSFYIEQVVPTITKTVTAQLGMENDDGNYGSAGTRDIECLQAISRRIHCGAFFPSRHLFKETQNPRERKREGT